MSEPQPIEILMVEDDTAQVELTRRLLDRFLEDQEYQISHSKTLAHAISAVKIVRFDVALVDLRLPDTAGIDAVRYLHQAAPELPLIVISGLSGAKLAADCVAAGAWGFLAKSQIAKDPLLLAQDVLVAWKRHTRRLIEAWRGLPCPVPSEQYTRAIESMDSEIANLQKLRDELTNKGK